jgi:hypothetical protein
MRLLSRRAALFAAPALAAGGITAAAPVAASPSATETLQLVAARGQSSLPATPVFGAQFVMLLELFDATAAAAGDGSLLGTVVNITADSPPKTVVQCGIVLRMPFKGELHLSTVHPMVLPSPVNNPLAIVGGTANYATARGDGTISYPTTNRINLTLQITTG